MMNSQKFQKLPFVGGTKARLLFFAPILGLLSSTATWADPLSEEQTNGLLKELDTIQDYLNGNRVSTRTTAVQSFQAAAASDKAVYEFYLQCHKKLKFDPRDASFAEFRDWRDKNEGKIKTPGNLAAMRLQLQYLVLTMRAAEGVERSVIVPELETFLGNIIAHAGDLGPEGLKTLRTPVKNTIFAEAYKLDRSLEVNNWSFSPGDFGAAYEKTIFPYIREVKPQSLGETWDRRIALEKKFTLVTQAGNQVALEKFESERLPRLNWQKASDIFMNVSEQQGASAMLQMLKSNSTHPDLTNWVKEFRDLITSRRAAAEPTTPAPSEAAPAKPGSPESFGFEKK